MEITTRWLDFKQALWGLVLLAGVFLPASAAATGGIVLSFDPLNGVIVQAAPPETLTVQVTVDSTATDLRGFSFVLEFDPGIVTPISVQPGTLLSGAPCGFFLTWLNETAIGDSIAVDAAALGCSMVGPGNIVEMKFVGVELGYGVSPLDWREVRMRDSANTVLDVKCVDGTIYHQVIIIGVEPESWARVKALYR
ncbi:MAG: hypothetical protein DHS20C21_07480 [Gemmatimonadota bacterium]|nr:MAG: hypothetical protein DHS20C21_07480 [Gemmatimonadota bacterium]